MHIYTYISSYYHSLGCYTYMYICICTYILYTILAISDTTHTIVCYMLHNVIYLLGLHESRPCYEMVFSPAWEHLLFKTCTLVQVRTPCSTCTMPNISAPQRPTLIM